MLTTTGSLFSSNMQHANCTELATQLPDRQFKVLGLKVKRKLAYSFTLY